MSRHTRSTARSAATGLGALSVATAVGLAGAVATADRADAAENHGGSTPPPLTGALPMLPSPDDEQTYTVRTGDTVSAIAHRFGTSISAIIQENGLNSRALIYVGQTLTIPGSSGSGSSDSSESSGSSDSSGSSSSGSSYTVRSGDTVSALALRFGTSVGAIVNANDLNSRAVIRIGQVLTIPGAGSSSGSSSSSGSGGSSSNSTSSSGGTTYTVVSGDTLSGIAARYGTTVAKITSLNSLTSTVIHPGQKLTVKGTSSGSSSSSSGSSSSSSSSSSSTSSSGTTAYTVKSGDTLSGIAARHGTTVSAITELSSLSSTVIYPGQVLTVPKPLVGSTFLTYTYSDSVVAAANQNKRTLLAADLPSPTQMQDIVRTTAEQMGVDPALALAVAYQESGFDPTAVSPANAVGVMQVIPSSGEWASDLVGRDLDLLDPHDNVVAGVAILRYLVGAAPDLKTAIAGYYQGLGSVTNKGMFSDTRRYVAGIQTLMTRYA